MTTKACPAVPPRVLSEILEALGQSPGDRLEVAEMIDAFGDRALGAMIVMFAMLGLLPWPPGVQAVFGLPLTILAVEVTLQRKSVWMPRWLMRLSVRRTSYAKGLAHVLPLVRRVERLSKPRLKALTGPAARVVIGLACLFLAIIFILPIPFAAVLPAGAIVVFGFALTQRDGLATLVGLIGTLACVVYVGLLSTVIVHLFAAAAT